MKYRVKKYKYYKPGEEIELEKVSKGEEITERVAYIAAAGFIALLIFNLIRFMF